MVKIESVTAIFPGSLWVSREPCAGWQLIGGLLKLSKSVAPKNDIPASSSRKFWIGIAGKRKPCGGRISGSRRSRPTTCLTNAPASPGWNMSAQSAVQRRRRSTAIPSRSQETELRGGEDLRNCGGDKLGTLDAISLDERWVEIKKRQDTAMLHPVAIYSHTIINTKVLAESLLRLGEFVAANGIEGDGPYQAARDLLLRMAPRIGGQPIRHPGEAALDAALRIVPALAGGIFPIQGPPGAGKTHTARA